MAVWGRLDFLLETKYLDIKIKGKDEWMLQSHNLAPTYGWS